MLWLLRIPHGNQPGGNAWRRLSKSWVKASFFVHFFFSFKQTTTTHFGSKDTKGKTHPYSKAAEIFLPAFNKADKDKDTPPKMGTGPGGLKRPGTQPKPCLNCRASRLSSPSGTRYMYSDTPYPALKELLEVTCIFKFVAPPRKNLGISRKQA